MMSMYFVAIACLIFVYPLISMVSLRLTSGSRLAFADQAKVMLAHPNVSEKHKEFITSMTDDVFDWRFMAFATLAFPFIAFSGRVESDLSEDDRRFFAMKETAELMNLHMKSVMGASPFFTATFVLVATLTFAIVIAFVGFSVVSMMWADTVKNISPSVSYKPAVHKFSR